MSYAAHHARCVRPSWPPTLRDFTTNRYDQNGQAYASFTAVPTAGFARASIATADDGSGNITSFASGALRRLARGCLFEEARTNSIRNSTAAGAVVGTPGTMPTNWGHAGANTAGLTAAVAGTGTEGGLAYVDISYSGTASGTTFEFIFESGSAIAASSGQAWSGSAYIRLSAGVASGVTVAAQVDCVGAASQILGSAQPLAALRARLLASGTAAASTTNVRSGVVVSGLVSGQPYAFTVRYSSPQLELGAFATSYIPTTTVAQFRPADNATETVSPPAAFTLFWEWEQMPAVPTVSLPCPGSISTADSTTAYVIPFYNAAGSFVLQRKSGSSPTNITSSKTVAAGSLIRLAARLTVGGTDGLCVLGGTVATGTGVSTPYPTGMDLRQGRWAGNPGYLNSYLRRMIMLPEALTDAQLQALTT